MRIVVLGSGVVGTTSAWYLAQAGHEVTVVERRDGPARETSFANAGQVSPGYSSPWAAPGIPLKALKWLCMEHAPLILRPRLDPAMARWLAAMLRNCTSTAYARNKERMVRLADYSRAQLEILRDTLAIDYDSGTSGTLQLFRTQAQLDAAGKDVAVLREAGVDHELLDARGCIAAEPGLAAAREGFVGGLRLPGDETGDCHLFTSALADRAAARGVTFRFGTDVLGFRRAPDGDVAQVVTDRGDLPADAVVVALGSFSPAMVRDFGIRLPIYPVKGYSLTAAIVDAAVAPRSTVLDETFKIAITRLGDRVRIGGMAEISGFSTDLPPRRRRSLEVCVDGLFPGASDLPHATYWSGLRPMTPDGTPIIGRTKVRNLYLNTGHGTLGWTMAAGSACLLRDLIEGRTPEIASEDLSLARYA